MSKVELNKIIPDLTCQMTGEKKIKMRDLKGKKIVLYFYPKDNTPGCTTESNKFWNSMLSVVHPGVLSFG